MRPFLRITYLSVFLSLCLSVNTSFGQLLYEGMVFDGMGKPQLENASSVSISPDGKFVYATSYNDNAVTVYSRETSGQTGELTFVEAIKNEVDNIVGMSGAFHMKISPDGNHVYVAGSQDNAIAVFNRNAVDGTLTYMTTYWNNVDGVEGIEGAYFIDIPADGNSVYVAGPDENAVAVFKRNVVTGELTFVQLIQDESGDVSEMNYPLALMTSPNGKHVYVTSFGDEAVTVFSRNLITGELEFVEQHKEGVAGVSGLQAAYAPYVTPDGLQVYVTGLDSEAVVAFNRNPSSGELTYVDTYVDNTNGVDGISGPTTIRASNDGNYIYVAGSNEDAVGVFSRNADSGEITFLTMIQEDVNGVTGIAYPTYLEVSEDGSNLYVAGFASASIGIFDINEMTGMPVFQSAETEASTAGVSGIDGSSAVTVSPDGNFVYVAGNNDDAIVVFERNATTGMLTYVQEIEDASATDGLNGINGIAISPDGSFAYATGFWDKSIVLFERDNVTGMLTYVERYKDNIAGVDGLNGVNFITISPDGNNVYVSAFWEHAVAVFSRNEITGKLTFMEVHKDGASGVDGLQRASGVTVSADGMSVYAAGYYDNAISIFTRATDGSLTYVGIVKDGVDGVDGIQRVNSVAVSPNNMHVYATGLNDDALAVFSRDASTGMLTYIEQVKNGVGDVVGLDGPTRLAISPNGEHIYATSINDDAIVAFRRDLTTGELTFESAEFDTSPGINGLDGAEYVAVSPDGKHMYAASAVDDAVAVFSCTYVFSTDQTICEGDSVVIGPNTYKISGTYVDTFSFGACKSVSTLSLLVQPAATVMDVEICDGDSYVLDGMTYNQTGSYDANLTSSHGCDSTITLNLTVVNEFSAVELVKSICEGETYMLGTTAHTTTGTYSETFTSSFGCDSIVMLDLNVNPVYHVDLDVEICEGDFYVLGTQNYIASGTFEESFTSVTGCDSIVTLNLTVVEPEAIVNQTICDGESFTLGTETFTNAGTYMVTVASSAGCDSEVTLNLNVESTYLSSLTALICEGDTYFFGTEVLTTSGVYTEVMSTVNGCDSTIILDLTVNPISTDLQETICAGESYTVGTTTYSESGDYTNVLTSINGCGDSTVNLILTVEPIEAVQYASICNGESFPFGDEEYTETGSYVQDIVSNAGCSIEYTLELTVEELYNTDLAEAVCDGGSFTIGTETYTESGNYSAMLTSTTGCDSIVNLNLTVLMPLEVTETISDDNGSSNGAIDLVVTGGMAPYTFEWNNGMMTEDIANLSVGDYSVLVTDANNCTDTYSFTVDQVNKTFEVDANIDIKVYPNPAPAGGMVNLSFDINGQQTLSIQLFDSVGKLISKESVGFISGNTVYSLRLPQVQGLYQLQIITEEGKHKTIQLSVK